MSKFIIYEVKDGHGYQNHLAFANNHTDALNYMAEYKAAGKLKEDWDLHADPIPMVGGAK